MIGLGLCLQNNSRTELIGPMLFSSFLFVFVFVFVFVFLFFFFFCFVLFFFLNFREPFVI